MNKYIGFLLLCGFLMVFDNLQGQDSLNQTLDTELLEGKYEDIPAGKLDFYNAYNNGKQLRNGALIVLLRSDSKRLRQLDILSRSEEYSENQQQIVLGKIKKIKKEKRLENQALIEGFQTRYIFSEVYFAYDSSLTSIQNGVRKGIFLDKNLTFDNTIKVATGSIHFCRYGLVSKSQEKEGLIVTNFENVKINAPFPTISVAGLSGVLLILNLFTHDEIYAKRSIAKNVEKLDRRLFNLLVAGKKTFDKK
jgi:hypothetical protein